MTHRILRLAAAAAALCGLVAGCTRSHPPAPSPAPAGTVVSNDVFVRASPNVRVGSLAEFEPDLPAVDGPFECGRREVMSPDTTTVFAAFPNMTETKATVVVFIDSTGKIFRYAERRGPPIRPAVPSGLESRATPAQVAAAAAAVRSTTITLDYRQGWASVANRGGGRPDQSMFGRIDDVVSMPKFGHPLERAARVLGQCDVKR